jgi:hypothetical protein
MAWTLLIPILLASIALATDSVVVDIVGSDTDNTQIVRPDAGSIELEIIGSIAENTIITSQSGINAAVNCCHPKNKHFRKQCQTHQIPHLGVDAWYGEYWYTSINMPKWPPQ